MKYSILVMMCIGIAGCAGAPVQLEESPVPAGPLGSAKALGPARVSGTVATDLTDVVGHPLTGRVNLLDTEGHPPLSFEVPNGRLETTVPVGSYRAYLYVYDYGVPVLVDVQDVTVDEGASSYLLLSLLEGASGALSLRDFDFDGDLAIDRVELACGTDPEDAGSIPGRKRLTLDTRVLASEAQWYCGELYAHSVHGRGRESVAQLVRRAERAGLDFLAITDRNTMVASADPDFHSDRVVLIPAMEWGTDDMGVALIYGPRTHPDAPTTIAAAQAECLRVQAQGGLFAIAHPCLPSAPWQWSLSYVNAIQVWNRGWRQVPPLSLEQLKEELQVKDGEKHVHSIAAVAANAALGGLSANAQAAQFWDYELIRGLMACAVAGSGSASPRVPLGRPATFVYAREKSLAGILEGLFLGRTYVSTGPDGPAVFMTAQVLAGDQARVGIGGVVPLHVDVLFEVGATKSAGKKIEVLLNGRPILTKIIEGDAFVQRFIQHPEVPSVYRARVIGPAENPKEGVGALDVYAMTSPIYAQDIIQELLWRQPGIDLDKLWVRIEPDRTPEVHLPEHVPPVNRRPVR